MRRGRKGFTLIELLVVIAIIGILASMVFPVFARARESARKAVCLSNMKNIVLAIQMYLSDNSDKFPPREHRQEIMDYLETFPGGEDDCRAGTENERVQGWATIANPYLRWPVVFDEYVKNRDVWNCPSAKVESGATFVMPGPDWFGYLQATEGQWGGGYGGLGPCQRSWPVGWGGAVTDSIVQQRLATDFAWLSGEEADSAHKAFIQSIGLREGGPVSTELKMVDIQDAARFPVAADEGTLTDSVCSATSLAYPEICCAECAGIAPFAWGWPSVDCPSGAYCAGCPPAHAPYLQLHDGDDRWRKTATRHLGGSNIGFADGHVAWFPAQRIMAMARDGDLECTGFWCAPTESPDAYRSYCGSDPDPGMTFP
jgi:prepilin-type N-terminal cleavage/methylation domain-containing protein/prepilin-type processing-associated H-X9-DG protein